MEINKVTKNRAFSVPIKGASPTMKDTMVETVAYAQALEGSLVNEQELIACLLAWRGTSAWTE